MTISQIIEDKLSAALAIEHMDVVNESGNHNVPDGSESHFRVSLVSKVFEGLRLLQRHRMVNEVLRVELEGPVHALALHTYTPGEWQARTGAIPSSPDCHGG